MKGITTAIREKIAAHGLSTTIVAKRLGIGRQTFSRKLNGHVDFSLSELTRLAEILGTTVADLMCRADQIANSGVALGYETPSRLMADAEARTEEAA